MPVYGFQYRNPGDDAWTDDLNWCSTRMARDALVRDHQDFETRTYTVLMDDLPAANPLLDQIRAIIGARPFSMEWSRENVLNDLEPSRPKAVLQCRDLLPEEVRRFAMLFPDEWTVEVNGAVIRVGQ